MDTPISFKVSLSTMFGEKYRVEDLDSLINAPVKYNGARVGTITGYDVEHDYIYGTLFDDCGWQVDQKSFSMEMVGRPSTVMEIAHELKMIQKGD